MRLSVICDGIVVNIVEWDGEPWTAPTGSTARPCEPDDVVGQSDQHPPSPTLEQRLIAVEQTLATVVKLKPGKKD